MSLGFTRDSIADLQKLYQYSSKEEEENFYTTAPAVTAATRKGNNGSGIDTNSSSSPASSIVGVEEDNDHDFLFFDEEDGDLNQVIHLLPIPQNDYDNTTNNHDNSSAATAGTTLATTSIVSQNDANVQNEEDGAKDKKGFTSNQAKADTIISTIQNTNATTTDKTITTSTKSSTENSSTTTNPPFYYSNFDYTSYSNEYNFNSYVDPYAPNLLTRNNNDSSSRMFGIFCCFFPNSNNKDDEDDDDESYSDSSDDSNDNIDSDTHDKKECKETHDSATTSPSSIDNVEERVQSDDDLSIDFSHHGLMDIHNDDLSLATSSHDVDADADGDENNENELSNIIRNDKGTEKKCQQVNEIEVNDTEEVATIKESSENNSSVIPTTATATTTPKPLTPKELLDTQPTKGILKRPITKPEFDSKATNTSNLRGINTNSKNQDQKRRCILPSYDVTSLDVTNDNSETTAPKEKKRVAFSPMARVVNITARNEMSYMTRSSIWWQRNDYDDFKKTGRIIAQAMLCGGSEIWLQTSDAWGKKQGQSGSPTKIGGTNTINENGNQESHLKAIQKYGVNTNGDNEEKDEDVGSKWWCKFGHSRRGLEHIVSIEEGKQRQRFVAIAVRAVLDEQRRQRISRKDPQKIAAVSMQYTSWARDLAYAAAAADAEAVKSNFNSKAKCRIDHLKRNLSGRSKAFDNSLNNVHVPSANFILSANPALTAKVLDANTHSNLNIQNIEAEEEKRSNENMIAKKAAGFQFQTPTQSEVSI